MALWILSMLDKMRALKHTFIGQMAKRSWIWPGQLLGSIVLLILFGVSKQYLGSAFQCLISVHYTAGKKNQNLPLAQVISYLVTAFFIVGFLIWKWAAPSPASSPASSPAGPPSLLTTKILALANHVTIALTISFISYHGVFHKSL